MDNTCVCCGAVIPEGQQVCKKCMAEDNAPCYGCMERSAECHSTCKRYLAYRAEKDKVRAKRLDTAKKAWDIASYKNDVHGKFAKKANEARKRGRPA